MKPLKELILTLPIYRSI